MDQNYIKSDQNKCLNGLNFVVFLRLDNQCIYMMKKLAVITVVMAGLMAFPFTGAAQYRTDAVSENAPESEVQSILAKADSTEVPVEITLEQAL